MSENHSQSPRQRTIRYSDERLILDRGPDDAPRAVEFRPSGEQKDGAKVLMLDIADREELDNELESIMQEDEVSLSTDLLGPEIIKNIRTFQTETGEECADSFYAKPDGPEYMHKYEGVSVLMKKSYQDVTKKEIDVVLDAVAFRLSDTRVRQLLDDETRNSILNKMEAIGGKGFSIGTYDFDEDFVIGSNAGTKFGVAPISSTSPTNDLEVIEKSVSGHLVPSSQVGGGLFEF